MPVGIPIGAEDNLEGVLDLVKMKEIIHKDEKGLELETRDIRQELKDVAEKYRENMLEALSDFDDELAEMFLEGQDIPAEKN